VDVVAAGVHDRHRLAVAVDAGRSARVREAGLLANRQRIHVSAEHHGRAHAVLEDSDDSGAPDPGGDCVTGSAESVGTQVTTAVVKAIFLVLLLDGIFAIFLSASGF